MIRAARLALAVAVVAAVFATAGAQVPPSPLIVTAGPVQNGSMSAVGYAPDFQIGCRTSVFAAVLVIETATGSATGIVSGECGAQWTALPAGSCRSNLPARPGYSCASVAGGVRKYASTGSSQSVRPFGFSEIAGDIWFQVDGSGAGAG